MPEKFWVEIPKIEYFFFSFCTWPVLDALKPQSFFQILQNNFFWIIVQIKYYVSLNFSVF